MVGIFHLSLDARIRPRYRRCSCHRRLRSGCVTPFPMSGDVSAYAAPHLIRRDRSSRDMTADYCCRFLRANQKERSEEPDASHGSMTRDRMCGGEARINSRGTTKYPAVPDRTSSGRHDERLTL